MSKKQVNESKETKNTTKTTTKKTPTKSKQVAQETTTSTTPTKTDTKPQNSSKAKKTPKTTPKPRNMSINLKEIQRRDKQLDKMSTHILDTDYEKNTNTIIKYYEKFSHDRIEALLNEAYKAIQQAENENIPFFQGENQESDFLGFISFLIAVRFTSLSDIVPTDFSESYPLMISMHRQGLTNKIHDEVLDQEEVMKIFDKLEQFQTIVNQIINLEESAREEILASVQNEEILNYNKPAVVHPLVNPKAVE